MGSTQAPPLVIRFGVFEADVRAGELRRNGIKVRLQDLPFRALTLLLSNPGKVISREEFRQALWPPDVFVDFEQGISSAMMRLRDALGDSAENPIFVETVERRGYRWIAPIHPPEPAISEPQDIDISKEEAAALLGKKLPQEDAPQPGEIVFEAPVGKATWRWRAFILVIVFLAILGVAWIFRSGFRAAKAVVRQGTIPAHGQHQPANREAEDFYLKGRFYWNKRTPESLNQAVDSFTQAIVHDPNYADAYVGLADCYNLMREFAAMPANEAFSRAFAAAKKAVELDENSSEAHASLAFVTYWGMWDAQDAEKHFRRAIELDPKNAKAHHWYATFLDGTGRANEAVSEIEIARALDPNSASILADKGALLFASGHHEEAMRLLLQLESAEPNFVSPHRYLRVAYFSQGDYPDYITELKKEALLTHDPATLAEAGAAERGFAKSGKLGMLQSQVEEQVKFYEQGKEPPCFVAKTYNVIGNKTEALHFLQACIDSHDEHALGLQHDPDWASYRGDPGFEQLLAKIKPLSHQP
jgi:DNA-binding winged helix-turn-helix (wHTH) protein/Tfp pilus assembly protein PilF